ncbi:hypothetical protein BJY52DRAFT_1215463 [Lactarius psammicola]|nr:hypothetical protein BJY52DRAFT_1215463 [Lactarius psammicola]
MTTTANFTSIPNLNYDPLASPDIRPALINVGFLHPEHPPIPTALFDEVVAYLPRFFVLAPMLFLRLSTDDASYKYARVQKYHNQLTALLRCC